MEINIHFGLINESACARAHIAIIFPNGCNCFIVLYPQKTELVISVLPQSKEISSDLCCFYGGGVSHNEDIMHSFQKFIVVSFPTTLPL